MPTNPRLVIGAEIIDSVVGGASASTIADAVFSFGDAQTGFQASSSPTEERIPFRIRIPKASGTNADLTTAIQDVLDMLDSMRTEGVIIEYESGQTLVEVDPATADAIKYETTRKYGDLGVIIEVQLVVEKFDASNFGRAYWQYQRNSSGRGFCIGRILEDTRAAAVAAAAPLRSGAVRPVWMPDSFRVVEDTNEFEQASGNIASLTDASYRPGEIVVVFEQLPAWAAGNSAFADVKRMAVKFEAAPRAPQNARAGGGSPGMDVTLTGTLEFKTEAGATYDAADTGNTVDSGDLPGKVVAAVNAIIAEAESRLGEGQFTLLQSLGKSVTGEDGVYDLNLQAITKGPNRVLSWSETELYEETFRGQFVPIADGSEWEFEHPGGDEHTIQHALEIVSIGGPRGYVKPQNLSGNDWRRIYLGDEPVEKNNAEGGVAQYRKAFKRNYKYVPRRPGRAGGGSRETVATPGGQSPTGHVGQFG